MYVCMIIIIMYDHHHHDHYHHHVCIHDHNHHHHVCVYEQECRRHYMQHLRSFAVGPWMPKEVGGLYQWTWHLHTVIYTQSVHI